MAVAFALITAACGVGLVSPSPVATACMPTESTARIATPMFDRPFAGDFPTGNLFDHDNPSQYTGENGDVLSMCGVHIEGVNGHDGIDWRMAEGTPLVAVAGGTVLAAGLSAPMFCAPKNQTVQALVVAIGHVAPNGDEIASIYGHLSRVDVALGQHVDAGATIGLSGNTGCSGTPHLHFGAMRNVRGLYVVFDPYGWHAASDDPWEADPRGTASTWLWRPGAAPSLR